MIVKIERMKDLFDEDYIEEMLLIGEAIRKIKEKRSQRAKLSPLRRFLASSGQLIR